MRLAEKIESGWLQEQGATREKLQTGAEIPHRSAARVVGDHIDALDGTVRRKEAAQLRRAHGRWKIIDDQV